MENLETKLVYGEGERVHDALEGGMFALVLGANVNAKTMKYDALRHSSEREPVDREAQAPGPLIELEASLYLSLVTRLPMPYM
uniref:Uncharacterized protein n=1 Tax=Peronospora matthiolae TaxID=2874970 RepID=A0AAV1UWA4_9STRA